MRPTIGYYRFLYDSVGRDWNWNSRKRLSDEQLVAIIHDPLDEVHVLYVEGVPAGFAELDRREKGESKAGEIEIVQFGLVPEFIGQGLGRGCRGRAPYRRRARGPRHLRPSHARVRLASRRSGADGRSDAPSAG